MGLDIYFNARKTEHHEPEEIAYWRKHNRLMGAVSKVLGVELENCVDYTLTVDHLDQLIDLATNHDLHEPTSGFFWGSPSPYYDEDREGDLFRFNKAKALIEEGYEVTFYAWWQIDYEKKNSY